MLLLRTSTKYLQCTCTFNTSRYTTINHKVCIWHHTYLKLKNSFLFNALMQQVAVQIICAVFLAQKVSKLCLKMILIPPASYEVACTHMLYAQVDQSTEKLGVQESTRNEAASSSQVVTT